MAVTFDRLAGVVSKTCDIPRDEIEPANHLIDDLGLDSLDLAELAFAIDREFSVALPIERWSQDVTERNVPAERYLVLENLRAAIAELTTSKLP